MPLMNRRMCCKLSRRAAIFVSKDFRKCARKNVSNQFTGRGEPEAYAAVGVKQKIVKSGNAVNAKLK